MGGDEAEMGESRERPTRARLARDESMLVTAAGVTRHVD
jgi:hypothetical protein